MTDNSDDMRADDMGGTEVLIGIGAGVWNDMDEDIQQGGRIIRAALLPEGTISGLPTVEILVRTADGDLIHANTTWLLWQAITNAFGSHESTWEAGLRDDG